MPTLSAVAVGFVYPFYPRFRAQWFRYNLADLPDLVVSTIVAIVGIEPTFNRVRPSAEVIEGCLWILKVS